MKLTELCVSCSSANGLLPVMSGLGVPRSTPLCQSSSIIRFLAARYGMQGMHVQPDTGSTPHTTLSGIVSLRGLQRERLNMNVAVRAPIVLEVVLTAPCNIKL